MASPIPFQFQTGSIKRDGRTPILAVVIEFQFQTGSIKRPTDLLNG